ncbi:MAG: hypothetical protein JWM64_2694 [Frankiales bacterium]|nr:hypothetical protein [Frankiales bacterium]
MKTSLRRLSAVAGLATTALVAGLLVAPGASAAITSITPNTAFDNETKALTFNFGDPSGNYFTGGTATFTRTGAAATFTATINPTPSTNGQTGTTGSITFSDLGDGLFSDGPADAGTYGATAQDRLRGPADSCSSCFTVLPSAKVAVGALSPNALRAGQAGQVVVSGDGFERGSKIELLLPGTTTVDPNINANQLPPADNDPTTRNDDTDGITTKVMLRRTFTVAAGAQTGARDVRVTNLDGTSSTLVKGFSVDGAPLTSTTPTGGNNDPSLPLTRVTFNGAGLNPAGTPFLQYVADPGSSTRDALGIRGTLVGTPTSSQLTADFDLRNAAPEGYLPVVRNPDGSSNACGCTFTVAQASTRVTTVSNLDSDTATAGTDKAQAAGTTKSFVVTGTGFAKGTRVTVSGAGVTTTAVQLLSDTALRATFSVAPGTAAGDRNVTATRTDGVTSAPCNACYTVTAATPSPSATPTASTSPSPSPSPTVPGLQVATPTVTITPSTITASQKAVVAGTATPGSTVQLYAYSRPSTQYQVVRTATVGTDGRYSFQVGPSGNTRLYVRSFNATSSAQSNSAVLTVRTSINLKVARTGTRTYRFTGSTLPKRVGQLVTVFYEDASGKRTIASRARVTEQGTYNVTRTFGGTGTFVLFTGTGTDNNNAANNSNRVRTTIR